MRTQFIYWKIQLAVLSATKKFDNPAFEMLEPFPKEDVNGNQVYSKPSYKLSDAQIDYLYDNVEELRIFRANAAACALYQWHQIGLSQYMEDEPRLDDMEEYLKQLALPHSQRTQFAYAGLNQGIDKVEVDVTGPCKTYRVKGKTFASPQVRLHITSLQQFSVMLDLNELCSSHSTFVSYLCFL